MTISVSPDCSVGSPDFDGISAVPNDRNHRNIASIDTIPTDAMVQSTAATDGTDYMPAACATYCDRTFAVMHCRRSTGSLASVVDDIYSLDVLSCVEHVSASLRRCTVASVIRSAFSIRRQVASRFQSYAFLGFLWRSSVAEYVTIP